MSNTNLEINNLTAEPSAKHVSASFGTLSFVSHATIVGIPVASSTLAGASLTLIFTVTTGVVKKL